MTSVVDEKNRTLVGGNFGYSVSKPNLPSASVQNLARILSDGSVDTQFGVNVASLGLGIVHAMAVVDQKIYVGGASVAAGSGGFLVRLNDDGSLDSSFTQLKEIDSVVNVIRRVPGVGIYVAGDFTEKLLRLIESTGLRDASFQSTDTVGGNFFLGGMVTSLAIDGDLLLVGGSADLKYRRVDDTGVLQTSYQFVRMTLNGAMDKTFWERFGQFLANQNANNPAESILSMAVMAPGHYFFGGSFTRLFGMTAMYLGEVDLNSGPALTLTPFSLFLTSLSGQGYTLDQGPVNLIKIIGPNLYLGGNFNVGMRAGGPNRSWGSLIRIPLANLTVTNGVSSFIPFDENFPSVNLSGFKGPVMTLTPRLDSGLAVGGSFLTFDGSSMPGFGFLPSL